MRRDAAKAKTAAVFEAEEAELLKAEQGYEVTELQAAGKGWVNVMRSHLEVAASNDRDLTEMMLERDRSGGLRLAQALARAMEEVGYCRQCRTLSEEELCPQCADPRRDDTLLCIVQSPVDVFAVEQTGFRGRYFVLKGHLSPLDGLGPEAIGIPELLGRVAEGNFKEAILATNPTVEGEATAHYIAQLLIPKGLTLSRIAHGVPLGGELDLVDGGTLAHALAGRKTITL